MWMPRTLGIAMMALLAGCASPAVRYYSLVPPAREAATVPGPGATGAVTEALRLRVTRIPPQADRPQLLVQDPAASPAVEVLNDSLWAAPLADEIQTALADRASRQRGWANLDHLPAAAGLSVRRIDVQVTRFDLSWGEAVHLAASWTDRRSDGTTDVCEASLRLPAGRSVSSLVEAARHAVASLAALIARTGPAAAAKDVPGVAIFGCTF